MYLFSPKEWSGSSYIIDNGPENTVAASSNDTPYGLAIIDVRNIHPEVCESFSDTEYYISLLPF